MKRLLPFLLIPVFWTYGPNAVGYRTIIETNLDDINIPNGATLTCNIQTEYGDHRLIEGKLNTVTVLNTQLHFIIVDTPLFKDVPLPLVETGEVEFCLVSGGH